MPADEEARASNGVSRYQNGQGEGASQPRGASSSSVSNGTFKASAHLNGSSQAEKGPAVASPPPTYFGHDREEVTRILIQTLAGMGYQTAAESVRRESGYELESPTVAAFRNNVLGGAWAEAEALLTDAVTSGDAGGVGNGLVLAPSSDKNVMRFWLRQQKFLELLEKQETSKALLVLRTELTPLYQDPQKLHFLSSLLMCQSTDDLKAKAEWDGAQGYSRKILLSELSKCISPSVMLPENRLAVLLEQVKQGQIDSCLWHTNPASPSLYSDHACDRNLFPRETVLQLTDQPGEVWGIQFSHNGRRLAGFGNEDTVTIWDVPSFDVVRTLGDHIEGVANIAWSPDDSLMVTCSRDKYARLWNVTTGQLLRKLEKFGEPVSGCVWAPDGQSFTVSSLDKDQSLRTYSREGEQICNWGKKHRVQDLCGSPDGRWIIAVDHLSTIHVYHAASRNLEFEMELKVRPTSVSVSEDSAYLLVNRTDGEAQLIELASRNPVQKFLGHTGGECLIRSAFGGANESFVVSGSEDGNILIWHKNSGAPVERLEGHSPRTNAVVWNPVDACMMASCGDDGRVRIWSNKAHGAALRRAGTSSNGHGSGSNGWQTEGANL